MQTLDVLSSGTCPTFLSHALDTGQARLARGPDALMTLHRAESPEEAETGGDTSLNQACRCLLSNRGWHRQSPTAQARGGVTLGGPGQSRGRTSQASALSHLHVRNCASVRVPTAGERRLSPRRSAQRGETRSSTRHLSVETIIFVRLIIVVVVRVVQRSAKSHVLRPDWTLIPTAAVVHTEDSL
ncbi:hypothetical protein Q5P01_024193 [Channa striata]|uniref:Uncharacterized protein n=1 Tax=Channa striata TaxID=64152 RepID=A0AA88IRV1_CHASR|nr:hypothetical protein Q5P01_024193 [Channa striata]